MQILKKNFPKVSIGMPVFNGEAVIRRAIDSLLTQSFEDFELIISDNASDDTTQEICREYAGKDKRIIYSRNDRNVGALRNFQAVASAARGQYFFWAAHDDWWHPDFIASAVEALDATPEASACMGVVHYVRPNGEEFMRHGPPYGLLQEKPGARAHAYFKSSLTDNLVYAVHRTEFVKKAPFILSTCPEKMIILHAILNGKVVDSERMEYFNMVSFKTQEEVAQTLAIKNYDDESEIVVFRSICSQLISTLPLTSVIRLFPTFVLKNNWHKFFVRRFLRKICVL